MSQARVILRKSLIGCTKQQKAAAYCLGLRKPGQIVMLDLNPVTEGQINKIQHLVSVERKK